MDILKYFEWLSSLRSAIIFRKTCPFSVRDEYFKATSIAGSYKFVRLLNAWRRPARKEAAVKCCEEAVEGYAKVRRSFPP